MSLAWPCHSKRPGQSPVRSYRFRLILGAFVWGGDACVIVIDGLEEVLLGLIYTPLPGLRLRSLKSLVDNINLLSIFAFVAFSGPLSTYPRAYQHSLTRRQLVQNLKMADVQIDECESVSSPNCPIEATIYGYRPNLGVNAFFVAAFAFFAIYHLGIGIRKKAYFFCGVMVMGSVGEAIGYYGRIMLYNNGVSRRLETKTSPILSLTPMLVRWNRLLHPDILPDLLTCFLRSSHLPDPETHRPHLRSLQVPHPSLPLYLDLHYLRYHLASPSSRWRRSCINIR